MENPKFLKKKYNLHNSLETESAALRTEKRTGRKVSQNPSERIQNYLNRFKEIINYENTEKKERFIQTLKNILYNKFIIKSDEIPESYFETQRRLVREQGYGNIEITDEMRAKETEAIINNQKKSLDIWIDYLLSKDAVFPDWLKYYVFRSILDIGEYDKKREQFNKRSKRTVGSFPELNRAVLAKVLGAVGRKYDNKLIDFPDGTTDSGKEEFNKFLAQENFAKLYALMIKKETFLTIDKESLKITKGEWIKYKKGSNHGFLVKSIYGYNTGWCVADETVAAELLSGGDFYIYYSFDKNGKPAVPRAAIRMEGNRIAEVRGIAWEQNLDSYIGDVVQEKMKEFPNARIYEKRVRDMKLLTIIEQKLKTSQELTKDELTFLYEINGKIDGFGFQQDPRIGELRKIRNSKDDAGIIFGYTPAEIACEQKDINESTKIYTGKFFPGIFNILPKSIKHLYASFPEEEIIRKSIMVGGKTFPEFLDFKKRGLRLGSSALGMLKKNKKFIFSDKNEYLDIVFLKTKNFGMLGEPIIKDVYQKAEIFGLKKCPIEVGPYLALSYLKLLSKKDKKIIYISGHNTQVFRINIHDGIVLLDDDQMYSLTTISTNDELVFCLPEK